MLDKRAAGILLYITSLPSDFGIGDFGPDARRFVDFLKKSGQRYWQILPLNPTRPEFGNSPYSSPSAFAGNTLLISPRLLYEDGLLSKKDLRQQSGRSESSIDFPNVISLKKKLFHKAFLNFKKSKANAGFEKFCSANFWLDDYAAFIVIKEHLKTASWTEWPDALKSRKSAALKKVRNEFKEAISKEKFLQYQFHQQWQALRNYCHQNEVQVFGDLPFYVNHESADVWANPYLFKLNKEGRAEQVSGVPPDYFSEDGQLWGNPVFHWENMEKSGFAWWLQRIRQNLQTVDLLRLDHFRAFSAYWEVPAHEPTARNGKWVPVPGKKLFDRIRKEFPLMPFIAEDLGEIDAPVYQLRDRYRLPGMRLLIYAFNSSMKENAFLPHNHIPNCVVYTGTHDNITIKGWFEKQATAKEKKWLMQYAAQNITKQNIHTVMLHLAYMSVARLVMVPLQDVLGLGAEAIMNKPATASGNWLWRAKRSFFSDAVVEKLNLLTRVYSR